jgi:hypothetical protein
MNVNPIDTLFIANPMWTGLESNLGFHGEKPVTKRLRHVTA